MAKFLIYGITEDDGYYSDPDAAIDKYYYWRQNGDGNWNQFFDLRQNVVNKVKSGVVEAYTYRNGKTGARCVVEISPRGVEYLKTIPNGDLSDNISSLPKM